VTRTERQVEALRKGDACIQVRDVSDQPCAGAPISVEQESHEFSFGCVVPELSTLSDADRERYRARLDEVFNCLIPATETESDVLRVELAGRVHLGALRLRLDQLSTVGLHQVHVWGEAVGLHESPDSGDEERDAGRRVADLYTLCFSHPAVSGVFWRGFVDGDSGVCGGGLLRRDLAPKYAFKVLQKLIGMVWHSRAAGVTDTEGLFRYRGFYGDYRVAAEIGGSAALVETIALRRGRPDQFQLGRTRSVSSPSSQVPDNGLSRTNSC
jgi:hypothetical protein